jgi:hypothetical protein
MPITLARSLGVIKVLVAILYAVSRPAVFGARQPVAAIGIS